MTLTKLTKGLVPVSLLTALPSSAFAAANLASDDFVGISFWLISMALMAQRFLSLGSSKRRCKWKTSLVVGALVCFIAAVHYFYMRDVWVATGETPTVYRYIDWLLTVPLLMIEFLLDSTSDWLMHRAGMFWRLLIGTLVMLVAGFMGEAGYINSMVGFVIGMAGWFYILYEIFAGDAGKMAADKLQKRFKAHLGTMRLVVTVGWAIYPLGYVLGYFVMDDDLGNTTAAASEAP